MSKKSGFEISCESRSKLFFKKIIYKYIKIKHSASYLTICLGIPQTVMITSLFVTFRESLADYDLHNYLNKR